MNKSIIIFGTGPDGREAIQFFGKEKCKYVVNDLTQGNEVFEEIPLISFNQLKKDIERKDLDLSLYDVVIAIRRSNIWGTLTGCNKFDQLGANFHVWHDIKKRWGSGSKFIERDRKSYPYERETFFEIRNAQLGYLIEHVDPRTLLPAKGEFRKYQLELVRLCFEFSKILEEYGVYPILDAGGLLGSVRHNGFIPWDDDLDFVLLEKEFFQLLKVLDQREDSEIIYLSGFEFRDNEYKEIWTYKDGSRYVPKDTIKYICCVGYGYLNVYFNPRKEDVRDNKFSVALFPIYYFSDDYTEADYKRDLLLAIEERKTNLIGYDQQYLQKMKKEGKIVEKSSKVTYGHPLFATLQLWFPGHLIEKSLAHTDDLLPLKPAMFEGYMFYQPANPDGWLVSQGYKNYMELPNNFPFDHHGVLLEKDNSLSLEKIIQNLLSRKK